MWPNEPYAEVDEEISSLIRETANELKKLGARVEEVELPFTFEEIDNIYSLLLNPLMLVTAPKETMEMLSEINDSVKKDDMSELAKVARGSVLKYTDWVIVNAMRQKIRQKWRSFFNDFDAILAPTTNVLAFKHNHANLHERKLVVNGKDKEYLTINLWAGPAVSAGLPSTNVPIGFSKDNLPIGMQITGPYLEDLTCIEIAKIIRDIRG